MMFGQPALLWALLAVAVPVVVHLVNFRRYKKVYFSNVQRLTALHTESRRRNNLRELLVLAARILAVAFLVLAFAQPYIPHKEQTFRPGATVVSLYIDNSFSMESASTEGSQLEAAKRKALEIASAYPADCRFQLMDNSMSGKNFRWLNRDELQEAVDELEISPATRMMSEIVNRQRVFMDRTGAANRHAYLLSDFQASVSDLEVLQPDSTTLITLVPLDAISTDNLYIDTVSLDAPTYFTGGQVTVRASVRNGGSHLVERVPVKLYIDGKERAMATADLPPGSVSHVDLHFTIDREGWLDGRVEIADYPVTFDDNYFFTLRAGERIAMLEIDAEGSPNPHLSRLFADDSAVGYRTVPAARLDASTVADYDIVLLNGVADIGTGLAHALEEWVNAGGCLAIVPTAGPPTDALNALLLALRAPRLGPWSDQPVKAASVDFRSRLYANVFNARSQDMEMPSVQGHYRLDPAGALGQSVIVLADGSDLLSAVPCGNGQVFLFACPLDEPWTDFAGQALFVPTLYNIALYSRPPEPVAYTLGTTSHIVLHSPIDLTTTPPELTNHQNYTAIPDIRQQGNRQLLMMHDDMLKAGHYTLGEEHLAFNYDRRESSLDFLSRDEVASRTALPVVKNADKPLDREIRARSEGRPLWRWCIALALAALAAETLLLRRKNDTAS